MAIKEALEVINRMQADGVIGKYAIGGAVGATFYIEPSATVDLDVFVELPNAAPGKLVSLAPLYKYLISRGCKAEGEYIVIGGWPVQFLPISNDLEGEALEQARKTEVEGVSTRVMTAEHLAAIALRTGRAKDRSRILQMLEQNVLDPATMQSIAARHGISSKWLDFKKTFHEQ